MKSPYGKSKREASKPPALSLEYRREGFLKWIGADAHYTEEMMKQWPTGGLLPNETIADVTHNILDRIKADPKGFRDALERYKRLNVNKELEPIR